MNVSKERIRALVHATVSNLGRMEAEGVDNIVVFHFLYPFRLEFAKQNLGKGEEFRPEEINHGEFELVIEVFRRVAARMPEAFRLDDASISPTDFSGKVVGWHNVANIEKYWKAGIDASPNPIDRIVDDVWRRHELQCGG